jgi:solute:Na+ symporter, SSS family
MNWIDWTTIALFCVVVFSVGMFFSKRASGNMVEYFLAGRKMPWWISAISMCATNFGSDTPLHSAGNARVGGVNNSLLYLRNILSEMSIAFFYAKLWRRCRILTDNEFFELRHGTRGGRALRVTISAYNSFIYSPFKIGLFTLAMRQIFQILFDIPNTTAIMGMQIDTAILLSFGLIVFALIYSVSAGLWGVSYASFVQFIIALAGSYALLVFVMKAVGGPSQMVSQIQSLTASGKLPYDLTSFLPANKGTVLWIVLLLLPFFWLMDGQLAPVQKMMACKTEKDAMMSQLVRTVVNFVLVSWPWIFCGIASVLLIPNLTDKNLAYPTLIRNYLPHGFVGLMIASLAAAFLSGVANYVNMGSAYFMNDIYRRFFAKGETEKHYILMSRLSTIAMAVLGMLVAILGENVLSIYFFLIKIHAGVFLIRSLRWFWWRINGITEVVAVVVAAVIAIAFEVMGKLHIQTPASWVCSNWKMASASSFSADVIYFFVEFLVILFFVTLAWVIAMIVTGPDPENCLKEFYRRVRPGGPGWKPIAKLCPEVKITDSLLGDFASWCVGWIFVYATIFMVGEMYVARWRYVLFLAGVTLISGLVLWYKILPRYNEFDFTKEKIAQQS